MNKNYEEVCKSIENTLQGLMDNCNSNNGSAVLIDKKTLQLIIWLLYEMRNSIC